MAKEVTDGQRKVSLTVSLPKELIERVKHMLANSADPDMTASQYIRMLVRSDLETRGNLPKG